MPRTKSATIAGVLLIDVASRPIASVGIGSDPRLSLLAADQVWMGEARERRITTLNLDRKVYVVLITAAGCGEMLVLSETPGDALLNFIGSVDFSWDILQHLLTDPFDAMTIVDDKAKIVYISPIHEAFFGLKAGEGNGRAVETVIDNTRLHEIVATGKSEVGKIQRIRGGAGWFPAYPSRGTARFSAPTKTKARHSARTKSFHQHVGGSDQPAQVQLAFGALEIQRHGLLAAIERTMKGRKLPCRVARSRPLHQDHLGAQVTQQQGCVGPWVLFSQTDHPNSSEGKTHLDALSGSDLTCNSPDSL